MEQWEVLVRSYPPSLKVRPFGKALQTATVVLKEDLAIFEKEWILQTLLLEPVQLLNTIQAKRSEDVWFKSIGDALILLSSIVERFSDQLDQYYEDIVQICQCPFDPQTRKQALECLTQVVKRSAIGASEAGKHVDALSAMTTCRAPLAVLVGTICEYHPEMVSDDANRIWRIYLNMLESNKNTDKLVSSILQGILGLFKHFGCNLPTSELMDFYKNLSSIYIKMSKCDKVCYNILEEHSNLFDVWLAKDLSLRDYLWATLSDWKMAAAIRSVYAAVSRTVTKERLEEIISSEIVPKLDSSFTISKFTSSRILIHSQTTHGVCLCVTTKLDIHRLEFELRNENVSFLIADSVSFAIEANLLNSDKLLQTAIMFYDNLPTSKKKDVVVYNILNAPAELRSAAITFLITETCQPNSIDKYLPLWMDMFNNDNGKDLTVVEKCQFIFEEFMGHLVLALETFLEEIGEAQTIPAKLSSLLTLASHILTMQSCEQYSRDYCLITLPLVVSCIYECGVTSSLMAAGRGLISHMSDDDDFGDLFKLVEIDRCGDEALLCECCLMLVQAPGVLGDPTDIVKALQIIFSRNDVEVKMLSTALRKLEQLIIKDTEPLKLVLDEILCSIENLKYRTDLIGKDARVLLKDITMFLGIHKRRNINNNNVNSENDVIVNLKESLVLNIPIPNEGTSLKINLQRILHLALLEQDPDVLHQLLAVISVNLSSRNDNAMALALTQVLSALCGSHVRDPRPGAVPRVPAACGTVRCVHNIIHLITESKSPGVRRMLSDSLEGLLLREPGSDVTESLLNAVGDHAVNMMASDLSSTKRAGLDITDTLLASIQDNNLLIKNILPNIIVLISKTFEITSENTFEKATKLFADKIYLFDENIIKNILNEMIKPQFKKDLNIKIFKKTVKLNLCFVKNVLDLKLMDYESFLRGHFDYLIETRDIFILSNIRVVFELKKDFCEELLCANNSEILNKFFEFQPRDNYDLEAILKFLKEYSGVLLTIQYEKTLQHLSDTISKMSPSSVKYIHKTLSTCLATLKNNLKRYPTTILTSIDNFCNSLPLDEITQNVEKDNFVSEHAVIVNSLKLILNSFELTSHQLSDLTAKMTIQKWAKTIFKLYASDDNMRTRMSYFTDILSVSVKFLAPDDIRELIREGSEVKKQSNEMIGVRFCRLFMVVFYEYVSDIDFWINMDNCCVLLNDIVKSFIRKKNPNDCQNIFELVEKLWPKYEAQTNFQQKYTLLLDLSCLPKSLKADSKPLQWVNTTLKSEETSRENRSRLIGVLPGGEEFSETYKHFSSFLPTRISDLNHNTDASFRAILDALACNKDLELLKIVVTLAGGDLTKGWWDDAIDSCMATLALKSDLDTLKFVYEQCWPALTLGVCNRVMIPLLRYSTPAVCERFFSIHLNSLLPILSKVPTHVSEHFKYQKYLLDYTKALVILQVAFEKVPVSSIKSTDSILYNEMNVTQEWYLVREICILCVALQKKVAYEGAERGYKEMCRIFLCSAFNCRGAAICRRQPSEKFYSELFMLVGSLVDNEMHYEIPLKERWAVRTRLHATSIVTSSAHTHTHSHTHTHTLTHTRTRTRLFLRTLSDNPLRYDLFDDEEDQDMQVETQELQLSDNQLNSHECMATLTSLLRHVGELYEQWTNGIATLLEGSKGDNVARFMAQAICNCMEDMKRHASALRPALLAFIVKTHIVRNDVEILDGLHINVLDTLTNWRDDIQLSNHAQTHLNSTIKYLINTCIENRGKDSLYRSLVENLKSVLEVYGRSQWVHIGWDVFVPYLKGQTKQCVHILKHIIKYNIYIPELLPSLLAEFERKHLSPTLNLAELFGNTLAICPDTGVKNEFLAKYRFQLEKVREKNVGEYVKMFYYAQLGYNGCCDEKNFRIITDLVQKLDSHRSKCLQIISSYIIEASNEVISDMFDTIDVCDLISNGETDAIVVVMNGLKVMDDDLRRRCVILVSKYCDHVVIKVRKAALQVLLKEFEELLKTKTQPPAKRQRTETATNLLKTFGSKDVYTNTLLSCLGRGAADTDEQTAGIVRIGLGRLFSTISSIRFTECFYMTIYQGLSDSTNNVRTDSMYALLDIYFSDLRAQENFKKIKLRDEPLSTNEESTFVVPTRSYHGTFRSALTNRTLSRRIVNQDTTRTIDVQVPIDNILGTLLQFAKTNPKVSQSLIIELMRILNTEDSDFKTIMSRQLTELVMRCPSELTPLIVEACKVIIDDVCRIDGFITSVTTLRDLTLGTEGEEITKVLLEDVTLRCLDDDQFVLGSPYNENTDVSMKDSNTFCLEDLVATFGKLSNWDQLTIQQKSRIERTCIPALWTDKDTFNEQLETYTGTGWFHKMSLAHKGERKQDSLMWLREIDRWPRNHFAVSAVTEAIQWQYNDEVVIPSYITPSDCLAEWAARLMLRSSHLAQSDEEPSTDDIMRSHSHVLQWCVSANERGLSSLVLDCMKHNISNLYKEETLEWLGQKVLALRDIGLKENDSSVLKKALNTAETYTPEFCEQSPPDAVIGMQKIILQLNYDLKYLSKNRLQDILHQTDIYAAKQDITQKNKKSLYSVYEYAMIYYDGLWATDIDHEKKEEILNDMADILGNVINYNITMDMFVTVIINKFDDSTKEISEVVARNILDKLQRIHHTLDSFCLEQLKNKIDIFPAHLLKQYSVMVKSDDVINTEKYKQCLQLIGDVSYTCVNYCELLYKACRGSDTEEWKKIFVRMKAKIFENPYSGVDYQLLNKYKKDLYDICDYDKSDLNKKQRILSSILKELGSKSISTLRLTALCPSLTRVEGDTCLARLLGISPSLSIVKCAEQVTVFTDSIRRPCVLTVVLSNGTSRRYLHKGGEQMKVDAAAQRAAKVAATIWDSAHFVGYNVTPLSEDCGMIEHLDNHERLRALISRKYDLDDHRIYRAEQEGICNPHQAAMELRRRCDMVPAHALRSEMERQSSCLEDFIAKKRRFLDSISTVTILSWIFGLGDRHLQNLLYNTQDGAVCCIDWGAIFQYGVSELPPARLTRNLLAVCDVQVLESKLQRLLTALRDSYNMYIQVIQMSFKWMGDDFIDKKSYIENLLQGKALPFEVTKLAIQKSDLTHKAASISLLAEVFAEFEKKETYSVQEQISSLLLHCTDRKILAVTRYGWEPWL